jgi:hypothetical protein
MARYADLLPLATHGIDRLHNRLRPRESLLSAADLPSGPGREHAFFVGCPAFNRGLHSRVRQQPQLLILSRSLKGLPDETPSAIVRLRNSRSSCVSAALPCRSERFGRSRARHPPQGVSSRNPQSLSERPLPVPPAATFLTPGPPRLAHMNLRALDGFATGYAVTRHPAKSSATCISDQAISARVSSWSRPNATLRSSNGEALRSNVSNKTVATRGHS